VRDDRELMKVRIAEASGRARNLLISSILHLNTDLNRGYYKRVKPCKRFEAYAQPAVTYQGADSGRI